MEETMTHATHDKACCCALAPIDAAAAEATRQDHARWCNASICAWAATVTDDEASRAARAAGHATIWIHAREHRSVHTHGAREHGMTARGG